jgi:hypothetical protein
MTKRLILATLLMLSFCAFVAWRRDVVKHSPPPAHIALVLDASDSMRRGCDEDANAIRGAMRSGGVKRGSTFTLIRTGDASTNQEPQLAFHERIPFANGNAFGGTKKAADTVAEFLGRAQAACDAVPVTTHSPIVKAVRRGIAQLKGLGCARASGCTLIVHSDLQDNDELAHGHRINGTTDSLLDNTGIRVVLCGFTATVKDGSAANTDSLLAIWQALFAEPVKAIPFCGEGVFANASTLNHERKRMGITQDVHSQQQHGFGRSPTGPAGLERPLFRFSETDVHRLIDAYEGCLICGSPGSGKSSSSGKNLAYALLRTPMAGGLILTAKAEETKNWISYAKACGREKDLIIFNAESGHVFDPLWYSWNRPGRGAGDLETIIDLFSTLQSIGKQHVGANNDRFWELATEQLMRNVLVLLSLSGEPVSIANMHRVIQSLPSRPGEFEEDAWQKESYCAGLINSIRERKDTLTPAQWNDLDIATHYAFKRWPGFDERPRSSIEMTWSGMADKFLFNPFSRLFCSGRATFVPELTTHQGKIVIVDFPMLQYGHETGRLINILVKLIFQQAWLRRDLAQSANPVFLWQDEFQYFVTRRDNTFQQTCRGARVAVTCLTQNILNLSEELGEQQPGSKTKAFLANLALKIFHQQSCPDTNTYAAELIGKQYKYLDSFNADASGGASTGAAQQLVYNVEPITFSQLVKPDAGNPLSTAIVFQGGKAFNATVTRENPRGRNYLTVGFSRDI